MKRSATRLSGYVSALFLAAAAVGGSGCLPQLPPDSPPVPGDLISVGPVQTMTADEVRQQHDQLILDKLGGPPADGLGGQLYIDWQNLITQIAVRMTEFKKITYMSRDANDTPIELTGMLYLPKRHLFEVFPTEVPLIAYPHGTELKRDRVPSNNQGDEVIFGAAAAIFGGYAVAMPDLPGMGGADPNRYHPYCHAKSLAYSVVDMIRAVRQHFEQDLHCRYRWNGQLYILGYSEGGYAAMATVKELQLNADQYPGLQITRSACLAGPHDLTGAMRQLMIDPNVHYPRPFFLPYVIFGYNAVYGGLFDPFKAMNPVLLPDIVQWENGSMSGDQVDPLIEQRMGVAPGQVVPRNLMEPNWVKEQLDDDVYQTSPVGQILAANNLWSGWAPNRPMLIMASPDDDCVPYANSVKAFTSFVDAGAGQYMTFIPIGKKGDGITHVEGAIIGIPSAIIWLKTGCLSH